VVASTLSLVDEWAVGFPSVAILFFIFVGGGWPLPKRFSGWDVGFV